MATQTSHRGQMVPLKDFFCVINWYFVLFGNKINNNLDSHIVSAIAHISQVLY